MTTTYGLLLLLLLCDFSKEFLFLFRVNQFDRFKFAGQNCEVRRGVSFSRLKIYVYEGKQN